MQPAKGTRNKYTNEDDRILWSWVNDNPQKGGGTDGNEIYKQLEKKVRGGNEILVDGITESQHSIHNIHGNLGGIAG